MKKRFSTLDVQMNPNHPIWDKKDSELALNAQSQKDVEASQGSEIFQEGGQQQSYELPATAYPSLGFVRWISDDMANVIASLIGSRDIPTTTPSDGIELLGFANQSTHLGKVYIEAGDNNGVVQCNFYVSSDGKITAELGAGVLASAAGVQSLTLVALTTATNVVNDILYITTRTNGTAAAGLGTGILFYIEDAAGNDQTAGDLHILWTDPTNGSESSLARFYSLEGGSQIYKIMMGTVFTSHLKTSISTSGQTTVFSITVPANYFAGAQGGHIHFKVCAYVDANANVRTLTPRLIVGGTTMTNAAYVFTMTANTNRVIIYEGWISRNASGVQEVVLRSGRGDVLGAYTEVIDETTASNTDTAAITISFTLQLSGSVDAGYFNAVAVEAKDTGSTF